MRPASRRDFCVLHDLAQNPAAALRITSPRLLVEQWIARGFNLKRPRPRRPAMLKLYGFAASNYFNMVKLVLLEKQLPFEIIPFHGCQNPEILAVSARGKVPVLGTRHGFLSETDVILNYIEESQPGPALLTSDPFSFNDTATTEIYTLSLHDALPI